MAPQVFQATWAVDDLAKPAGSPMTEGDASQPPKHPSASVASSSGIGVRVRLRQQERTVWCWAAVAQYVLLRLRETERSQCLIATEHFSGDPANGVGDCCCETANRCGLDCDEVENLDDVLRAMGFEVEAVEGKVDEHKLRSALGNGGTVCARSSRFDGHFVVLSRLLTGSSGEEFIEVLDPAGGEVRITRFDQLDALYCPRALTHLYFVREKEAQP